MKKLSVLLTGLIIFISGNSSGAEKSDKAVQRIEIKVELKDRYYEWCYGAKELPNCTFFDKDTLNSIKSKLTITKQSADSIEGSMNYFDLYPLRKKHPRIVAFYEPFEEDLFTSPRPDNLVDYSFPLLYRFHHDYAELLEVFWELKNQYPQWVEVFSAGRTHEGRFIPAMRISTPSRKERAALIVGGTHAKEHISVDVPIGMFKHLLAQADKEPSVAKKLAELEFYFIPMANPDGANYDLEGKFFNGWRKNRSSYMNGHVGVDINRNFDFQFGAPGSSSALSEDIYHGPFPESEPETRALTEFVRRRPQIKLLLTYHSYFEEVFYPWAHTTEKVPEDDLNTFLEIGGEIAKLNKYDLNQASNDYVHSGDLCDWAYAERGIYCFVIELPLRFPLGYGTFYPPITSLMNSSRKNRQVIDYLLQRLLKF